MSGSVPLCYHSHTVSTEGKSSREAALSLVNLLFSVMQQISPKAKWSKWSSEVAKRPNEISTLCQSIREVVTVMIVDWDKPLNRNNISKY